jgi:uncharacterized membrane protein
MLNPFDLKTVLLVKRAQHVVLIHFPIALFISAVAFDLFAHWMKRQALAHAPTTTCCWQRFQNFQFSPPAFSHGSSNSRGRN